VLVARPSVSHLGVLQIGLGAFVWFIWAFGVAQFAPLEDYALGAVFVVERIIYRLPFVIADYFRKRDTLTPQFVRGVAQEIGVTIGDPRMAPEPEPFIPCEHAGAQRRGFDAAIPRPVVRARSCAADHDGQAELPHGAGHDELEVCGIGGETRGHPAIG
jgi:hypothetical protein